MIFCPLCHRELAVGTETAVVPVSPVVYPGVRGLDVHAICLADARRGAFEVLRRRSRVPAIMLITLLLVTILVSAIIF